MRLAALLLSLLILPVLAAAQENLIIQANFDLDSVGEAPDPTLPGGPEGDYFQPLVGIGSLTVVDSAGDFSSKPLLGERPSGAGSFKFGLPFPEYAQSSRLFTIKFCVQALSVNPTTFWALRGDQGRIFAMIYTRGPNVNLLTSAGETSATSYTQANANCFEWHLDFEASKQSLWLNGALVADGFDLVNDADLPIRTFQYESTDQIGFSVVFDDIEVYSDAFVSTESISWGAIKARYR